MSDAIEAVSPSEARQMAGQVRALLSGKRPDRAKARALLAQFQGRLWQDFAKHGDSRIRQVCSIVDELRKAID